MKKSKIKKSDSLRQFIGNWKLKIGNSCRRQAGFSIVELLVVTMIFSILAVLTTQSIFLTLRGSRKSESLVAVRENVDYAFAIMERQIRNAQSIDCPDPVTLNYTDEHGASSSFTCETLGPDTYINSGSGRLTNSEVTITCSSIFICDAGGGGVPPSVRIEISAQAAESFGAEGAEITTSTRILLRSY
ncbi:prepilin-type N-terminal cleavage/methylation domain-containing protein [Patescibacteria group bacterium]|nr:prepilin-type N-terminal cleavage/methylation domain-containing protein [Patescibacteria group bacterium]